MPCFSLLCLAVLTAPRAAGADSFPSQLTGSAATPASAAEPESSGTHTAGELLESVGAEGDNETTQEASLQVAVVALSTGRTTDGVMMKWGYDHTYCMSVVDNTFRDGQKLQLWKCLNALGQHFQFDRSGGGSTMLLKAAAAPAFCVVIDANSNQNGAAIQLWRCDANNRAQHWTADCPHVTVRNAAFPDKCLVVNGNAGSNGNKLQLWDCHGSEEYKTWLCS